MHGINSLLIPKHKFQAKIGNSSCLPNNIDSRHRFESIFINNISSLKRLDLGLINRVFEARFSCSD